MKTIKAKIKDIKTNPNNPRYIKDEKFNKLVQSIKELPEMLQLRPIVVNEDMVVLGGNMRLKACQKAGLKEVPIIKASDLTPEQQKEFIIKDNVGFGEWDWDMIANEWDSEQLEDWGLELPFDVETEEAEEDNYQIPDEIKTDIVLGDLIEIGEHRLLCGDSTDSEQVAKLMDGDKADMVFTDPPYGINIGSQSQGKGGGVAKKINYGKNEWDKEVPIQGILNCLKLSENCVIWGGNYFANTLPASSCWIVWDKDNGDTDFADIEIAWTSYKKASRLFKWKWAGMLQEDMKNKEKRVHPTQKPINLATWVFKKFNVKKVVVDLFLGSGTTLIACEKTNRICYGMELDNKYCQVIIDRMLKLDEDLEVKVNGKPYKVKEMQDA